MMTMTWNTSTKKKTGKRNDSLAEDKKMLGYGSLGSYSTFLIL